MTADLEQRLRRTLDDDASKAPRVERAPVGLRRMVRRHQAGTAAVSALTIMALVAGSVAAVRAFDHNGIAPIPAGELTRPVFERTATIEGFTVTSPSDWYMVDRWAASGQLLAFELGQQRLAPVLEISNFDPGLDGAVCDVTPGSGNPLPPGGFVIFIGLETGTNAGSWNADEMCGGNAVIAGTSGLRYGADGEPIPYEEWLATADPQPSGDAFVTAQTIYESIRPDIHWGAPTHPNLDTAGYVLWGGTDPDGSTWTIEARPTDVNVDLLRLTRTPDGNYSQGGVADFAVPPENVDGGVMGVVNQDALGVEYRPADDGTPTQAQLADLPPSLGYAADAYYFPEGYPTNGQPPDGKLVAVMPAWYRFDVVVVGEGTHPTGGHWRIDASFVTGDDGVGSSPTLGVGFGEHGAGWGVIEPLNGEVFSLQGYSSRPIGSAEPAMIFGLASADAASVAFEPTGGGAQVEGMLFPIPDRFVGPAQAFIVFLDGAAGVRPKGDMVAYGAGGQELGRINLEALGTH